MKNIWHFEDILDFYYFVQLDTEKGEEQHLHQRDRSYFLQAQNKGYTAKPSPQHCLRIWLKNRRAKELNNAAPFLPGDAIREAHAIFRLILLIGGILVGCGLGFSYFVYTGKTPLNVFQFLTIFIIPQLLIIIILVVRAAISPTQSRRLSSLGNLLHSLYNRLFFTLKKKTIQKLSTEKRANITKILTKEQGSLSFWPLFLASQLFALGFNIGITAVTLLKIITTDLAFGWQSTLQLGPENLFSIVKFIALPWSWLLSADFSYPSLLQIEGSRIILKDSIQHLLTQDLTSWWPFLLLCLLFYGLLPRLVLLFFGVFMEQRSFTIHLQQNKYKAVYKRMVTPFFSTQASPQKTKTVAQPFVPVQMQKDPAPVGSGQKPVLVLIPDDIYTNCSLPAIEELLRPHNYQPVERQRIFKSYDDDLEVLASLSEMSRHDLNGIVVLLEAWMAPIKEHIRFLHSITESIPENIAMSVLFLGRPSSNTIFTPPDGNDIQIWQPQVSNLNDKVIFLEPLFPKKHDQQTPS